MKRHDGRLWKAALAAGTLGCLLACAVWCCLGYISRDGLRLTYIVASEVKPSFLTTASKTLHQIALHACGLWMEGGLLLLPLGLLGGWRLARSGERGGIARLCLSVATISLIGVAFHTARFMSGEEARPALRYAFYSNLTLIPLAAWALMDGHLSRRFNGRFLAVTIAALSSVLLWPQVWKHMCEIDFYFANAPSMQVYTKMDDWPKYAVWALLTAIGLTAAALVSRRPRVGTILVLVLLGTISRHAIDRCLHVQNRSLKKFGGEGVHALCARISDGDWEGMPIVCQYDPYVDFLARDIRFLLKTDRVRLAPEYGGERPYLFVTFQTLGDETLVVEAGGLKTYLMTGDDKGPPPANYTPGPPPWY